MTDELIEPTVIRPGRVPPNKVLGHRIPLPEHATYGKGWDIITGFIAGVSTTYCFSIPNGGCQRCPCGQVIWDNRNGEPPTRD